jgi:hypothetical protein
LFTCTYENRVIHTYDVDERNVTPHPNNTPVQQQTHITLNVRWKSIVFSRFLSFDFPWHHSLARRIIIFVTARPTPSSLCTHTPRARCVLNKLYTDLPHTRLLTKWIVNAFHIFFSPFYLPPRTPIILYVGRRDKFNRTHARNTLINKTERKRMCIIIYTSRGDGE